MFFRRLLGFGAKFAPKLRTLDNTDIEIITRFANGEEEYRGLATSIYRAACLEGVRIDSHSCMGYMHEVDNEFPDLNLRALYRQKLLQRSGDIGSILFIGNY